MSQTNSHQDLENGDSGDLSLEQIPQVEDLSESQKRMPSKSTNLAKDRLSTNSFSSLLSVETEDGADSPTHFSLTKIKQEPTNTPEQASFDPFSYFKDRFLGSSDQNKSSDVDWEFWGKVVSNFDQIATKQPKLLTKKVQLGVPASIRGMVWQLLCKGKNPQLETVYFTLQSRDTTMEKQITRDLARTFPKHEYFQNEGPGQEALFNILKAYSLYDVEVGYCQGISFVVGALLLNVFPS